MTALVVTASVILYLLFGLVTLRLGVKYDITPPKDFQNSPGLLLVPVIFWPVAVLVVVYAFVAELLGCFTGFLFWVAGVKRNG